VPARRPTAPEGHRCCSFPGTAPEGQRCCYCSPADLDQRPLSHQRHRTGPSRRRPRPPHPRSNLDQQQLRVSAAVTPIRTTTALTLRRCSRDGGGSALSSLRAGPQQRRVSAVITPAETTHPDAVASRLVGCRPVDNVGAPLMSLRPRKQQPRCPPGVALATSVPT